MLLIKSQNKADVEDAQRRHWWAKTPQERLAAAAQLYAANPPLTHGERVGKPATPVPR